MLDAELVPEADGAGKPGDFASPGKSAVPDILASNSKRLIIAFLIDYDEFTYAR